MGINYIFNAFGRRVYTQEGLYNSNKNIFTCFCFSTWRDLDGNNCNIFIICSAGWVLPGAISGRSSIPEDNQPLEEQGYDEYGDQNPDPEFMEQVKPGEYDQSDDTTIIDDGDY